MVITADERRSVLGLWNVAEAARYIGLSVRKLHFEVESQRMLAPTVQIGRRRYYRADDLPILQKQQQDRT